MRKPIRLEPQEPKVIGWRQGYTVHRFLCLVGFLAMFVCMSAIETCAMEDILQYSIAGFLWLIFAAANAYWGGLMDKPSGRRRARRWR